MSGDYDVSISKDSYGDYHVSVRDGDSHSDYYGKHGPDPDDFRDNKPAPKKGKHGVFAQVAAGFLTGCTFGLATLIPEVREALNSE